MNHNSMNEKMTVPTLYGTTIVSVRKGDTVVMAGDGQVTLGSQVVKASAAKVRRIRDGRILVGFAGATADAFALLERLEVHLDQHSGHLMRACVELARDFRSEKYMKKLEAMMLVADEQDSFTVTGVGDVLSPENGLMSVGSGSVFALAAAQALLANTDLDAEAIAREALRIASQLCIYTNDHILLEKIERKGNDKDSLDSTPSDQPGGTPEGSGGDPEGLSEKSSKNFEGLGSRDAKESNKEEGDDKENSAFVLVESAIEKGNKYAEEKNKKEVPEVTSSQAVPPQVTAPNTSILSLKEFVQRSEPQTTPPKTSPDPHPEAPKTPTLQLASRPLTPKELPLRTTPLSEKKPASIRPPSIQTFGRVVQYGFADFFENLSSYATKSPDETSPNTTKES